MAKRIIFVDDDPLVLAAFERLLRALRSEWNMEFIPGGRAAREALEGQPADLVVTDMKMPDFSGVELLEYIKRHHPRTLRIALSGESDRDSMLRAATIAHYYLTKPCEPGTLASVIQRALSLQDKLSSKSLNEILGKVDRLPSAPTVYTKLVEAMRSPACNIVAVSEIVKEDMAIASKLLQLANSPLFGFRYQVSNPAHAVSLLGVDAVKSLVLSLGVFSEFLGDPAIGSKAAHLFEHSVAASRFARKIGELAGLDKHSVEDCFAAGLLHEIGKLVILTHLPDEWRLIDRAMEDEHISLPQAERSILSCTQDEIGAHLLELWCLPSPVVEAVAWRSHPSESSIETMGPLAALHLADSACVENNDPGRECLELDRTFLLRCGIEPEPLLAECRDLTPRRDPQ